jgi:hypothetical protein
MTALFLSAQRLHLQPLKCMNGSSIGELHRVIKLYAGVAVHLDEWYNERIVVQQ